MWAAWGWGRHCNSLPPPTTVHSMLLLLAVFRYLVQLVATGLQRFLARFSGRRRPYCSFRHKSPPWTILALVVAFSSLFSIVEGCSSRTTPKPRPPAPTARPNVTFLTFECPPAYAAWYCLNGATCFTVKIGESLLYNCECSEGYMGPRCEYKDLDGSYLPSQRRILLETASIAGGATIAIILVFVLCLLVYVHYKRRTKEALQQQQQLSHTNITSLAMTHNTTTTTHSPTLDCVDGTLTQLNNTHKRLPIFGKHYQQQQRRQQQQQQHLVEQQQQQQRHLLSLSNSDINNHNYPPRNNASCCGNNDYLPRNNRCCGNNDFSGGNNDCSGGNNDYLPRNGSHGNNDCNSSNNDYLPRNNSCGGGNNDCSNNDYLPRNGSHGNNDCSSSNNDYLPRNVVCCSGGENNDSAELQQVKTISSDECGGEGDVTTSERISEGGGFSPSAPSGGEH